MGTEDEKKFGKKCECDHFKVEHILEPKGAGKLGILFIGDYFSIGREERMKCMKCSCSKYKPPKWYSSR